MLYPANDLESCCPFISSEAGTSSTDLWAMAPVSAAWMECHLLAQQHWIVGLLPRHLSARGSGCFALTDYMVDICSLETFKPEPKFQAQESWRMKRL
jgi:hypothetical protein